MEYRIRVKQIIIILIAGILFACILIGYDYIEKKSDSIQNSQEPEEELSEVTALLAVDNSHITANTGEEIGIHWWYNSEDGKYYFFFPSPADLTGIKLEYQGSKVLRVDGIPIPNGSSCSLTEGEHVMDEGEGSESFPVVILQSTNLASLYLTTQSGNLGFINIDKEHKESGTAIAVDADGFCTYHGKVESIAGRGNTTWDYSNKRGYQITFPIKEDMFGMGAAKKWVLLANYFDETLLRNDFAYHLAEVSGMPFSPETVFVDLYINGYYWGNYQVSEKIEVDEERVNIPDLQKATEKRNPDKELWEYDKFGMESLEQTNSIPETQMGYEIPNDPADITGGYLLEYDLGDRYLHEDSGFATKLNQAVVIKSPKYASRAQVDYISKLYQQFEDAVTVYDGVNVDTGKCYYDYIDMNSFAKAYLIEEITKNVDASNSSRYFYKYPDSYSDKFYAGPVWDYDLALGNYDFPEDLYYPDELYAMQPTDKFNLWYALYYREEFQQAFKEEYWNTFRGNALLGATDRIKEKSEAMEDSVLMDRIRWFRATYENMEVARVDFRNKANKLQNFIINRIAYLDEEWAIQ